MNTINQMVKQVTDQAIEEASQNHLFNRVKQDFESQVGSIQVEVSKRSGAMMQRKIARGCFAVTFKLDGKRIARAKLEEKMKQAA